MWTTEVYRHTIHTMHSHTYLHSCTYAHTHPSDTHRHSSNVYNQNAKHCKGSKSFLQHNNNKKIKYSQIKGTGKHNVYACLKTKSLQKIPVSKENIYLISWAAIVVPDWELRVMACFLLHCLRLSHDDLPISIYPHIHELHPDKLCIWRRIISITLRLCNFIR